MNLSKTLARAVKLHRDGKLAEAERLYTKILAVRRDDFHALHLLGVLRHQIGKPREALHLIGAALEINPEHAEAHWNESLVHLCLGDFSEGWRKYEWRWRYEKSAAKLPNFSQPRWLGAEDITGKTVMLYPEQGFGDTLQFVRYAPLVAQRGADVILVVQSELHRLLAHASGTNQVLTHGDNLVPFDFYCPLLSLPLAFGTEPATIPAVVPYVSADARLVAQWQRRLPMSAGLRVGVAWAGRPTHWDDRNRSIALERLLPLFSVPDISFVSLQKGLREGEASLLSRHHVLHLGDDFIDFSDTAAVVAALDLVISVDSAIIHLAGAMARPTFVLLPFSSDFRWLLNRDDSPWYPTMRLYRQGAIGDWEGVIGRVRNALVEWAPMRNLREVVLPSSLLPESTPQQIHQGTVADFPDIRQRYLIGLNNNDMLWQKLRQSVTQPTIWFDLARDYASHGLPWQAGYAARQALRFDATLKSALQALDMGNWQDMTSGDAALGRVTLPEADSLVERFIIRLKECPGDWLTWLYLARLQEILVSDNQLGNSSSSLGYALQQAQSLEPMAGESLHWMGVWRLNAGDTQGAVSALSGLRGTRPVRFGSMMYLGEALLRLGNIAEAEKAFALASLSPNPEFLQTLATKVYAHNYWQEAMEVLKKALAFKPDSVSILLALANIQSEVYALGDCRETLHRIRELEPNNSEARLLGAGLQGRMGDAKGHLSTLRTAYELSGDPLSRMASSIAMTALYHDSLSPREVADLHRELCAPIEAAVTRKTNFSNSDLSNRRLRIGCVTGDLHRQHPVNIFMLPVLLRFDHTRLDIFVYHTGTMHDEYTRQAKACSEHWLEAAKLDDAALHRAIIADGIDILIDLAGHSSTHRLGIFAMRAAPVQVTFLGYPHSTGLSTIDWLIGDPIVSPIEHAHLFSEGLAQLPDSVFCWSPVDEYPLPPPRPMDAPVVFGSFNNAMKLSPKTIALWARVLQAVPNSLMLLKAPSLRDTAVQERFAELFAERGIGRERLIFRGPSGLAEMMREYGDIDIALDPTPYNGGTTTLQALWMGVPVVTLAGGNFVARMGASFMTNLGQPNWVAETEKEYVEVAVTLARKVDILRSGRTLSRERMVASPLCDIKTYVSNFEDLLHRMWNIRHENNWPRVIRAKIEKSVVPPCVMNNVTNPLKVRL